MTDDTKLMKNPHRPSERMRVFYVEVIGDDVLALRAEQIEEAVENAVYELGYPPCPATRVRVEPA